METIRFACPTCGNLIELPILLAGRAGACPHCSAEVTVPMGSTVSPPVIRELPNVRSGSRRRSMEITTKNTSSLTLGMVAVILGSLTFFIGWIPFLGLLAVPVAVIGLVLAGIGLLAAILGGFRGFGMPLLGVLICIMSISISVTSTGVATGVIDDVAEARTKAASQLDSETTDSAEHSGLQMDDDLLKENYIATKLRLYDAEVRYMQSVLNGKVAGATFKIENNGDLTLARAKVTVFFKNSVGRIISEEDFIPFSDSFRFSGSDKPLKPGYIWQNEKGTFLSADSVPDEWQEGSVDIKIVDIDFVE